MTLQEYGAFFHNERLPREALERFAELVAETEVQAVELRMTAEHGMPPPTATVLRALERQAADGQQAAEKAILGAQGYDDLKAYERTMPARASAEALYLQTVDIDPMTAQQVEALTQAISDASPDYRSGGRVYMPDIKLATLEPVAKAMLSPAQWEMFLSHDTNETNRLFEVAWQTEQASKRN